MDHSAQTEDPLPLEPSRSKCLYEPIVLLYCLIQVNHKYKNTRTPDLETDSHKSPKDAFFCFVDKLGQISDSAVGGDTVTSFAVLQPNVIEYRFASNNRDYQALVGVQEYIASILTRLGKATDSELKKKNWDNSKSIFSQILQKVMSFSRQAIRLYIGTLLEKCDFCIDACNREGTDQVSQSGETLLRAIDRLYHSDFEEFIRIKARQDADPANQSSWSKFRHAMGRLESYYIAVKVLISMRKRHPILFDDFIVTFVPSSPLGETPIVRSQASKIISPLDSNIKEIVSTESCQPSRKKPKAYDIDAKMKVLHKPKNFQPYVHVEVNLLDSILREESKNNERIRFYGESEFGKYIGCSKPTCRLCKLYFDAHPSGVQVRPSHLNLYYNWRVPDIYKSDGPAALKTRNNIVDHIIASIRNVAFETIDTQVVTRKPRDSNTDPSDPLNSTDSGSSMGMIGDGDDDDDLTTMIDDLDLESGPDGNDSEGSIFDVSRSVESFSTLLTMPGNGKGSDGEEVEVVGIDKDFDGVDDDDDDDDGGVAV
ncbi:hypothetical protein B0T17DRAFT_585561 [Bombardia bombarda]|uniref:Uncharacterized protein n=1 Tax=Bombardia bombarda TaxID=252184 RepID=A0AA39U0Z0_9PEZI|nr:hypothetical protein B0T17DRAFT_585561 [Bombardia bombarda]